MNNDHSELVHHKTGTSLWTLSANRPLAERSNDGQVCLPDEPENHPDQHLNNP